MVSHLVQIINNAKQDAREMAMGLKTIGGAIVKPVVEVGNEAYKQKSLAPVKKAFINAYNNRGQLTKIAKGATAGGIVGAFTPIGILGGAILGGTVKASGGPKNFANAILSNYNTNLDELEKLSTYKNPEFYKGIARGMYQHPLYAAADLTSLGGGKLLKGGISKIAVPEKAPLAIQQLLPSKQLRQFNRDLSEVMVGSKAKQGVRYGGYNALSSTPMANRLEITKKIMYNKGKLTPSENKLAVSIRNDLIANEKSAIQQGLLDPVQSKNNTVAQYVIGHVGGERSNLLHQDIVDIINGAKPRDTANKIILDKKLGGEISSLINKGSKLYDENKIAYLTQRLAAETDPLQEVLASELNKNAKSYWDTSRVIGRTSPERLSKFLDSSVRLQLDDISRANEALDVVNNVIGDKKFGIKKEAADAIRGKFVESLSQDLKAGQDLDVAKALTSSGLSAKLGDVYSTAVKNAFAGRPNSTITGFTNAFKKAVLANPHWVALNRIGNWTNNAMEGVTLTDYLESVAGKYRKLVPKQLKQQTSFSSYINEGDSGLYNISSSFAEPVNKILRAKDKFSAGKKGLKDVGKLLTDVYSSSSDIVANPVFKMEAAMELSDRYANFVRQAKRYAEANGMKVEAVLKKANTDQALFNQLNREVNKSLGDYIGRNYTMPPALYNLASETIPFYRFLTQTGRTTAHQLTNNPLGFASMVSLPARAGTQMGKDIMQAYNLDPDMYSGGVPYKIDKNTGMPTRMIGFEPLPAGSVASQLANMIDLTDLGGLNPLFSTLHDVAHYEKFGRQATSLGKVLHDMGLTDQNRYEEYEPTTSERYRYLLNNILSETNAPYIWTTKYGPEIFHTLKRDGLNSLYDTGLEFHKDKKGNIKLLRNPDSYKKLTPEELIGRWIGIQTGGVYTKQRPSMSTIKKKNKSFARKRANVYKKISRSLEDE